MITRNQVILKAEDGHMLTQAGEVELIHRVFVSEAWLADSDSVDNYKEITKAEADALISEQEAEIARRAESEEPRAEGEELLPNP